MIADEFSGGKIWGELQAFNSSFFLSMLSSLYTEAAPRILRFILRRLILVSGRVNRLRVQPNAEADLFFSLLRGEKPYLQEQQVHGVKVLAQRHFLAAYLFERLNQKNIEDLAVWREIKRNESYKEACVQMELTALRDNLPEELSPILLKGASLIHRIYKKPGLRFMSDVDLLVTPEEKLRVEETLLNMDYIRVTEDHGPANRCKSMWTKPMFDSEMVIDLHEKLNWFQSPTVNWIFLPSRFKGYRQMEIFDEILYLSIHLTYSHNFQRLFWLVDIYEILKDNEGKINWQKFSERAKELNAERAVAAVSVALKKTHGCQIEAYPAIKYPILNMLITEDFLLNPYKSMLRFLILKHLLQDTLINAIKYDYYRIMISVNRRFKRSYQ